MAPKKRKSKLSRGKPVTNVDKELKIDEKQSKRGTECSEEPLSLSAERRKGHGHVAPSSTPSSHKVGSERGRKTNNATPGACIKISGCSLICGCDI